MIKLFRCLSVAFLITLNIHFLKAQGKSELVIPIGETLILKKSPESLEKITVQGDLRIADRAPTGTLDPEVTALGTHDFTTNWVEGQKFNFDSGEIGAVAGNKVQIEIDELRYREFSEGERDKIDTYEIPFSFKNITITLT